MKRFFFRQLSLVLIIAMLLSLTGVAENDGSMFTNDDDALTANEIALEEADLDVGAAEDVVPEVLGDINLLPDILLEDGNISAPGEPAGPMELPDPAETLAPDKKESTDPPKATVENNEKTVPKELTLGKGETYDFGIKNATITTNKKSIVSVDKKRIIKAEGTGSAKITVKTGKKTYTCKVTVLKAPGSVTLSIKKLTLPATDTYKLKVSFPNKTASNKLTWKSSNTKVAAVDENGIVTGVKKGTAKITVTTFNKKSATCKVTVNNDPAYVSFPMESITIGKGESVTIKPEVNKGAKPKYTWKSKKKTVATVDKNGKITGKKAGSSTTITVETQNGKKATLKVNVKAAPGSVTLSDATVEVGSTVQLKAKLKSKTASYKLTWKSSDKKIAKVDKNGVVTGVKEGTAKITVTTFNKKKATCTVTVNAPVPVVGTITSLTLKFGDIVAGDETVVIPNEAVTASWVAEGEVESYYYQLLDASGTIVASQDAVATTSYEIAAGAINTGEVYTLKVGAMPTSGTEENILWKAASFKRNVAQDAGTSIDESTFPDNTFRQTVQAYDTDGDGKLSEAEAAAANELNLSGVSTLAGIEVFTGLRSLSCKNSGLIQIDLSKNTALETLDLSGNNLSTLDITKNIGLKRLDVSNNNLTTLDLSKNTALTSINVSGNQLTSLDISKSPSLVKCVTNGSRTEENGVVIYSDGNATLVVSRGVVIITDLPVVGTITSLKIFFDGVEAVEGENVIADTAVTASWVAEGDVASYIYAITKTNGESVASGNGADVTNYAIAADALTAGEVYTLTVKAIPTNGTENEASSVSAKFKRRLINKDVPTPAQYFTYEPINGLYAQITGYTGTDTIITVPSEIDDYIIQKIGNNALKNNKNIEYVFLPDTVEEIGSAAFYGCTALVGVDVGNSVKTIGSDAFNGCTSLIGVAFPSSLTTTGSCLFRNCVNLESFDYPINWAKAGDYTIAGCSKITKLTIPEGATLVPDNAFGYCNNLIEIEISSTITKMGQSAFRNCLGLTTIVIPGNVVSLNGFLNCTNLTDVKLNIGIKEIGNSAFEGCTSISTLDLPEGLETIGESTFRGCTNLISALLPDSVTKIGKNAYENCKLLDTFKYPIGLSSITTGTFVANNVFRGCEKLRRITVPEGVTVIPANTFNGANYLRYVDLPNGLKELGNSAFEGCTAITTLEFPDGLEIIGESCFNGCTYLQSALLPDSVTQIGKNAYENCKNLATFKYPKGLNKITTGTFVANNVFRGCEKLTSITVPQGVTRIPNNTFNGANFLKNVDLPDGLIEIGGSAFEGCSAITTLALPESLEKIGEYAFKDCTYLESALLPDTVTTIGRNAYENCQSLVAFKYPKGLSKISTGTFYAGDVFRGCKVLDHITIPEGVTTIPANTFRGANYLVGVDIPSSVQKIEGCAFNECTVLEKVYLGYNVTSIGRDAFSSCPVLTIWTEYGATALQYAKDSNINYYYLTPDGVNSPSGTLYKGDSYTLYGYARSSINVTELTASILDNSGSILQTITVNPNVTDYSLSGHVNTSLTFGNLELGSYRFMLKAKTALSEEIWADNGFTIVPPPLRIYLSGYNLNNGIVDKGNVSAISGTVISNYPITSLSIEVYLSNGTRAYNMTVSPGTTTYALSNMASEIPIEKLPVGEYTIRITAVSNGETKVLADNTFSPVDMGGNVDEATLQAVVKFVSNSDNSLLFTGAYVNNALSKMGPKEILLMSLNSRSSWVYGMASTLFSENGENMYLVDLYEGEIADIIADLNPNTIQLTNLDKNFKFISDKLIEGDEILISFFEQKDIANDIYYDVAADFAEFNNALNIVKTNMKGIKMTVDMANSLSKSLCNYMNGIAILSEVSESASNGSPEFKLAMQRMYAKYKSESINYIITGLETLSTELLKTSVNQISTAVASAFSSMDAYFSGGTALLLVNLAIDVIMKLSGGSAIADDYQTFMIQVEAYDAGRTSYMTAFEKVRRGDTSAQAVNRLLLTFSYAKQSGLRIHDTISKLKFLSTDEAKEVLDYYSELQSVTIR